MTKKRGYANKLSFKTLTIVAVFSIVGIIASIILLNANLANKPQTTNYSGCAAAEQGPGGVIHEADLSCMTRYQGALDTWEKLNYLYVTSITLLTIALFADGVVADIRIRKNRQHKL